MIETCFIRFPVSIDGSSHIISVVSLKQDVGVWFQVHVSVSQAYSSSSRC